jgi:RNA polymerase sigma-70 factor (ECF subfamily)
MTDKELINKLKHKEESAFKYLINKYQVQIRNTCLGMLHDSFEADDMAQEVFIEVFKSIHKFKHESNIYTWIYRIAINKCLNALRSKKRKNLFDRFFGQNENENYHFSIPDNNEPQKIMEDNERAGILQVAVDSLPENQKVAFVLSKYDDLSNPQIAEIMGTSVSSVESLHFRAKKNLQRKLIKIFKEMDR